jgi:hypothetical protein
VAVAGSVLDRILHRDGISHQYLLDLSNVLTGLLAGIIFYHWRREHLRHEKLLEEKLRVVAELNHHIRNALQVIALYAARVHDDDELQLIREATERIEWSLREILPAYPDRLKKPPVGSSRMAG